MKMEKCECWREEHASWAFASGRCLGTKEIDLCDCGGDETKCDFYTERRRNAIERRCGGNEVKKMAKVIDCRKCANCDMTNDRCKLYGPDPKKAVELCASKNFGGYRPTRGVESRPGGVTR